MFKKSAWDDQRFVTWCDKKQPSAITNTRLQCLRQDWSMLSCCLHQILILPSKCYSRYRDSSDHTALFQLSVVQFWWVHANFSLSFLYLAERSGTQVSSAFFHCYCSSEHTICPTWARQMYCVFRNTLLYTLVLTSGYEWFSLLISLKQSESFYILTSDINIHPE